jgi:hypothetical protein
LVLPVRVCQYRAVLDHLMVTYGARCHSFVLVAQVNHLQNLQTWLKTIAIDLPTAITASDICNNGMELVSTTNVQPRSIVRRHNNRLADSGNSKRYLQQCHGIALKETTPKLAGSTRCHSLGERYRNNGVKSVSRQHEVQSRSTAQQHNSNKSATVTPTPATKQRQTDKATAGNSMTLSFTVQIAQRRQLTGGNLGP